MVVNVQVTFDAAEPRTLGGFWRDLLEYDEDPPPPGYDSWDALMDEMGLSEEERGNWYACSDPPEDQRRRVDAAVGRALAAGATQSRVLEERGEYCVVMADPEGNEFCLQ